MNTLSVICVNWNSVHYLRDCLTSVYSNTIGLDLEIIVVDNASLEDDVFILKAAFPEIILIRSNQNLGFVRANNLGYKHSSGECLLFLNPDTTVTGAAITEMWRQLHLLPDAGIVGCRLLNSDLSVQTSCIQRFPTIINQVLDIEWLRMRWPMAPLWGIAPLFSKVGSVVEVEVISGACLMLRRETFERAGLFSGDYFMYAEDVDLCFKIRQMGLKNYYVPSAAVIHHGGGSSRCRSGGEWAAVMQRQSLFTFCKKTRSAYYAWFFRVAIGLAAFVRLIALAFLYPAEKIAGARDGLSNAFRKWWAVFRWAIGSLRPIER